jgi:hypothetical protein
MVSFSGEGLLQSRVTRGRRQLSHQLVSLDTRGGEVTITQMINLKYRRDTLREYSGEIAAIPY